MSMEIEKLVENSKAPEALARIFDFAAEKLAAPLEFTHDGHDGAAPEEEKTDKECFDAR